ncbi:MAG: hypothetical protein ACLQBB_16445 [Solirubrobacteraceae bacterium]
MLPRAVRRAALPLLGGVAILCAGCGSGRHPTPAGLRLQRADLIATAAALSGAQREVDSEVTSTKAAWPIVVNGLPARLGTAQQALIARAAAQAAGLKVPDIFQEQRAETITGPGNPLAGDFRNFASLSAIGWRMIVYAIEQRRGGTPPAVRFTAANVPLYIDSVYDAHFGLAQIGKKLLAGYKHLGGAATFGSSLSQAEVERLAGVYSEARYRLHPHSGVKLGS